MRAGGAVPSVPWPAWNSLTGFRAQVNAFPWENENGDILKYSCLATQHRRSVLRETPFGQADWPKATAGAPGFRRHYAPAPPTMQKEHDEQGHFFLTNTVLLTTRLHTALWLRPDIYLEMSPSPRATSRLHILAVVVSHFPKQVTTG